MIDNVNVIEITIFPRLECICFLFTSFSNATTTRCNIYPVIVFTSTRVLGAKIVLHVVLVFLHRGNPQNKSGVSYRKFILSSSHSIIMQEREKERISKRS